MSFRGPPRNLAAKPDTHCARRRLSDEHVVLSYEPLIKRHVGWPRPLVKQMFSLPVRIFIGVAAAVFGVFQLANGEQSGYMFLAATGLIAFGYFRYGSIRPAYLAMRRGDLESARKHIETIKYPKLLSAESRAYLHWVSGAVAADESKDLPYAEEQMRLALSGALRTSNDRCVATAMLAQIVAKNNDLERAKQILAAAEQIPHRNNTSDYLRELRSEFEKAK